jgi:hypothetical protein
METMSITRALTQIKRISDRINQAIQSGTFVAKTVGKNKYRKVLGSNDSIEDMISKIQGSYDSVDSLVALRARLKSAIVMSNATTDVTVVGRKMKVCEAIELKSTIEFRKHYLNTLGAQFAQNKLQVETANAKLDQAIEVSVNAIYGSDKSKVTEDTYKMVSDPQKEQKEVALLDPQKIEKRIQDLADEISMIESEIDMCLTEINSITTITV